MEVDVRPHRDLGRLGGQETRPLERLDPPSLDHLGLVGRKIEFCRRHACVFGHAAITVVPCPGDSP